MAACTCLQGQEFTVGSEDGLGPKMITAFANGFATDLGSYEILA
eukprot:SAG22_NODE_2188_length_2865_cov_5.442878_3_plen_44_part_00